MRKLLKIILVILITVVIITNEVVFARIIEDANYSKDNIKRDLLILMASYPEHINTIEKNEDGNIYLIMKDGKKILYDDNKNKSIEDKFVNADLQDILEEEYPLSSINKVMDANKDPGRIRHYGFLGSIYGNSKESIEKNLAYVDTYYGTVMFNKQNGAAENLKRALNEAGELSKNIPKISGFVSPLSGTYNYRVIQDTGLLSPHSYGIAIDLNKNDSDYWKWVTKEKGDLRIASYPKELVQVFEKYGFVWGGKWSHFDILHFEYKPEVILKAKYFSNSNELESENWYGTIPREQKINEFILLIDEVIGQWGGYGKIVKNKKNINEDIFVETLASNTIIKSVDDMAKDNSKDKEGLNTVYDELNILVEKNKD